MFDEPLGALDAFTRMAMQDEILRIRHENIMTMVMVTHDVDEAVYSQPKLKSIDEATEYNLYYELDGGVNADSNKDKYAERILQLILHLRQNVDLTLKAGIGTKILIV